MRFGEVKSLKWGAVDLERGLITIFDAKGGKSRTAFMTPEVREMFKGRTKRGGPENLVFPTFDGREYADTPTTFRDAVEAIGFQSGNNRPEAKGCFSYPAPFIRFMVGRGRDGHLHRQGAFGTWDNNHDRTICAPVPG